MKIIIKNPAPVGPNQQKWGDYHFGRSLSKYLERLGAEVETHYYPDWSQPNRCDAVLLLRGKHQYSPTPGTNNLLWCMSNPSTITAGECDSYDAACVASVKHAIQLRAQTTTPVHPLLQCTDLEEFEQPEPATHRKGFVFVGNSRGVRRLCLDWAIAFGLDVKVYGRGWRDWNRQQWVVSDYVANEDLPALYASSQLTLNDHWQDMKALGYINNRIFDCLAAGLPVLSDDFPELREVCADAILYYDDQASFNDSLTEALMSYPSVLEQQRTVWRKIRKDFSFEQRALFLYDLIRDLAGRKRADFEPTAEKTEGSNAGDPFQWARLEHITAQRHLDPQGRYCPLCGGRSKTFLTGGANRKRKSAKCPSCGSLERHRLFWLYFVNKLWPKLPEGLKQLLHIAPEEHSARLLHQKEDINYLSGDLEMANVMVKLDLTNLDFPDKRFDIIVCSHVLEHVPDDHRAISEMFRVTRPGGYTLVQVPIYGEATYEDFSITTPEGRLKHFAQADHVRKYRQDIEERLSAAGFQVAARRPRLEVASEVAEFLALKDQIIYECHRPAK